MSLAAPAGGVPRQEAAGAGWASLPRLRFPVLLLGLVLLVLVPALAVGVAATLRAAEGGRAAAEDRLRGIARALAHAMDAELDAHVRTLAALATAPTFDRGGEADPATVDAVLRRAGAVLGSAIALIAPDGRQLAHTGLPPGVPAPPTQRTAALRTVLETGRPVVLDLHVGAVVRRPVVATMVPVLRDGRAVAALVTRIEVGRLRDVLVAQAMPPDGFAAVMDSGHVLVARSDALHGALLGRPVPAEDAARFAGAEEGLYRATAPDGVERVFGFSALRVAPGWTVVVAQPAAAIEDASRGPLLALGAGGVLALAFGAALALLIGRQVVVPLRRLGEHARAVATSGDASADGEAAALRPAPVAELEAVRRGFAAAEAALRRRLEAERAACAALRESEDRLRTATDNARVGLVVMDAGRRYRFANRAYAELLGLPSHEIAGLHVADVRTPLYEAQIRPRLDRAFGGERVEYELVRPAAAGRGEACFAVTYEPGRDTAGEPVVVAVITDVTERALAARALAEGERMLRLALDAAELGAWRWEVAQGADRLEWDARCKALFGLPADAEVTYADWARALPDEDRAAAEAGVARALDPADPHDDFGCEYRARHPDGTVLWLAASGRAFFELDRAAPGGRRALRIIGAIGDVTAARRAEEERRRTGALLRAVVEVAPGLIYAKDPQGRMVLANGATLALIGKPWAEVEGRTDLELLDDPAQAEAVMANDRRVMEAGRAEELEELVGGARGAGGAGARVWLARKTPLHDADGRLAGLVGVSVEITGRKRDEERLRLVMHELNHRVKNTLATVQAIAAQTLRGVDPAIRRALEGRLGALAAAHDVLTRESWAGAELDEVVDGVLAAYGGRGSDRFRVSGPPVRLQPRAALALALGLHELATNALRFGALSPGAEGWVALRWDTAEGRLRLSWSERGGPPVAAPSRRGFGTRLIERSLAQDLGGIVEVAFGPEGLACTVDAPLAEVAAEDAVALPPVGGGAGEAGE